MEGDRQPEQLSEEQRRNQALHLMAENGWANISDGDPDSLIGWFAIVANNEQEMYEIWDAFEEEFERLGVTREQLLGNFLLRVDDQLNVTVTAYAQYRDAYGVMVRLSEKYAMWLIEFESAAVNHTQERALRGLCERYGVEFEFSHYAPAWDLPDGYVAGWIGGVQGERIYVGCDPEGRISS